MTDRQPTARTPLHLMQLFAERAAEGDLAGVMALYEPQAVFEPQFGLVLEGQDQIRPAIQEFLMLRPQITYVGDSDVVIRGDIALVSNTWSMTGQTPDGAAVGESGVSADVLRRQGDGSWKILIDQPRGTPSNA